MLTAAKRPQKKKENKPINVTRLAIYYLHQYLHPGCQHDPLHLNTSHRCNAPRLATGLREPPQITALPLSRPRERAPRSRARTGSRSPGRS